MYTPPRKLRHPDDNPEKNDDEDEPTNHSTPIQHSKYSEDIDSSPLALTQETEVCWDWSPTANSNDRLLKQTMRRKHRLHKKPQSPLVTHMQPRLKTEQIKLQNNLKERLDALQKEILRKKPIKPTDGNLVNFIKPSEPSVSSAGNFIKPSEPSVSVPAADTRQNVDDLFENDDFIADELVLCSQQVEAEYLQRKCDKVDTVVSRSCVDVKFGDDSFDQIFGAIDDDILETLTQASSVQTVINIKLDDKLKKVPIGSNSESISKEKCTIFRDVKARSKSPVSKCTLAEIERKRQEAKAIRERKVLARPKSSTDIVNDGNLPSTSRKFQHRNQSLEFQNITISSPPSQCTYDEIERKRIEAMAKRGQKMFERTKSSTDIDLQSSIQSSFESSPNKLNYSSPYETSPLSTWSSPTKYNPDQIERKRLEALAKRGKKLFTTNQYSATECTADEIERKRLEALAKRGKKLFDRSKSHAEINSTEFPDSRSVKRNNSFELTSPISSKSRENNAVKDIKSWEAVQIEIEKKRQQALARLKRKKEF